ncbi:aminoglycoside adenylyltransferase family protein [Streptomyces litchfieldiae]|uniref:Aminoglycoside adenylyltransferase family protein n=1 Tax=Streptomyces litchfieldiae TaxID=3075543 RepID=A0ABU2MZT1_9ACTN|nr:aminoglycoside adenylyltransferase family protein [Streptomyces sp. DSM 44938]MDT0346872.1 aminoglycoside adenylyltransferase family protein [Streptomyces sp. DSM 44938]
MSDDQTRGGPLTETEQVERVVLLVRDVLGPDVLGVYLHGSAVLGGTRPTSDVDVFAVVRRSTTEAERRALVEGLLDVSGAPARPVELTVVVQSEVRPWRYPPRCEFQYGEWLRADYERGETPAPGPMPDLAPLITVVLLGNAPLFGPPPGEVLDPVPPGDLRRAIVAGVPDLLAELAEDTRNVVLTLARIWTTLVTGDIRSKDAAADWALARLPAEHRPVLARARACYLGEERERWDDLGSRVRSYAAHVAGEIERLAP